MEVGDPAQAWPAAQAAGGSAQKKIVGRQAQREKPGGAQVEL